MLSGLISSGEKIRQQAKSYNTNKTILSYYTGQLQHHHGELAIVPMESPSLSKECDGYRTGCKGTCLTAGGVARASRFTVRRRPHVGAQPWCPSGRVHWHVLTRTDRAYFRYTSRLELKSSWDRDCFSWIGQATPARHLARFAYYTLWIDDKNYFKHSIYFDTFKSHFQWVTIGQGTLGKKKHGQARLYTDENEVDIIINGKN